MSKLTVDHSLIKGILLLVGLLGLSACNLDKSNKNQSSHLSDTIDLSLYGVSLGDSVTSLYDKFPDLVEVGLGSIYDLPYTEEELQIFNELGISLYTVDTIFIANIRDYDNKSYELSNNGKQIDFTKHRARLCFMGKDQKVFQSEMYIFSRTLDDAVDVSSASNDICGSIKEMFYNKYQEPDSVLMFNPKNNKAAFVGYNEEPALRNETERLLLWESGISYIHEQDVWIWQNAKIYADWDFDLYRNGKRRYWGGYRPTIKISYIDYIAVKKQKEQYQNEIQRAEEDSIRAIQKIFLEYNSKNEKQFNTQDF